MSNIAFQDFELALRDQHVKNEARRIRTRVSEARFSPQTAGLRWPFELLQNALDAGPRSGHTSVTIQLSRQQDSVIFDHNGSPFTAQELAALLSGGSSKDFESEHTTGRFGTGFLVTHVLAERTSLRGLLAVNGGHETFNLMLDRTGDETAILENIRKCYECIRDAAAVIDIENLPSASFVYKVTEDASLLLGFDAFKRALPYLYATRPQLGEVCLTLPNGLKETWSNKHEHHHEFEDSTIHERFVHVINSAGELVSDLRIIRVETDAQKAAACVIVLERTLCGWRVCVPDPEIPRVFRDYPVRLSTFLPINFILNGKFSVDQERSKLLMEDGDKQLLRDALRAAVTAMKLACEEKWQLRHLLARASTTKFGFDAENSSERQWWKETLHSFANAVSSLNIVETANGCFPANLNAERHADFILPRLLANSIADEATIMNLWPLFKAARHFDPPLQELASDWSSLADGWDSLDVEISRVSVKQLGETVRQKATGIHELDLEMPAVEWLSKYIDVVGQCWKQRNGIEAAVLEKLLPNQNGVLCSPKDLRRDLDVSLELKNISADIGSDLRAQLLMIELDRASNSPELPHLGFALSKVIPQQVTEQTALDEVVGQLSKLLVPDSKFSNKQTQIFHGSIRLFAHLARTQGITGDNLAKRVPLVTQDSAIVNWSKERMLMAPATKWHPDAQPFIKAYPEGRLLLPAYSGAEPLSLPDVIPALISWGICFGDPFVTAFPAAELKERRLAALATDPLAAEGFTVTGEKFVQIALLHPEVLNRCQEGREEAKALLGLAVSYMARNDSSWRSLRVVKGRKPGEEKNLTIRGALWLADLSYRAWVPVPADDGKFTKTVASQATLRDLIESSWLSGNDGGIEFLTQCFGFDALELRLLGTVPDEAERAELRNNLAKLIEVGGGDPKIYEKLAETLVENHKRAKAVQRCRNIGIAVQEAIKMALETRGLTITLVDRGFDYEITCPPDDLFEEAIFHLEVGSYLLEVKATTHGDARLTPLQAATAAAESNRFILCVVDLSDVAPDRLEASWSAADVEPLAKIVSGVGIHTKLTCELVDKAKIQRIAISNETALRYTISKSVWSSGCSIGSWIDSLKT